jgi:hypothetical protein
LPQVGKRRRTTLPELLHRLVDRVQVLHYVSYWADRELRAFIDRAKGAAVPGTIAGHPDQEAMGFAGRPDRALLKSAVNFILPGALVQHEKILLISLLYQRQFIITSFVPAAEIWVITRKRRYSVRQELTNSDRKFPSQGFQLPPAQISFLIRKFLVDPGKLLTVNQLGTFLTIALIASQGAVTDRTAVFSFSAFATRTFGVVQKPIQTSAEFGERKTFIPRKAVSPPILPESI